MRASIVMMLCAGCGVFGGGAKAMEGTWEGECDTEDDQGNDYNYDVTFDLVKSGDALEGDGEFDSSIVLTVSTTGYGYYVDEFELTGDGDVRAEKASGEWTIEGHEWEIEVENVDLGDLNTADWELVGTQDGSEFTGDVELDLLGEITVRGSCDLDQS